MLRLTCAVIDATGPAVHLVIVQAAVSPDDENGRSAIEAAFATQRVAPPGTVDATGSTTDG